jgi:predicted MFS family arabinose efflux permease
MLMAIVSLVFSGIVIRFEKRVKHRSFDHIFKVLGDRNIIISMSAYFLLQLSGGLMFTYSERIGVEAGLTTSSIGMMLSLSSVFSILGAFLVIRVSQKFAVIPQIILFSFLMMMSMVCLFHAEKSWIFFLGLSLISISWSYLLPFHQQNQSSYDELGRVVSVGSVINMLGRATGPAIGAVMLGSAPFENVLWISIITVIISTGLFSFVLNSDQSTE